MIALLGKDNYKVGCITKGAHRWTPLFPKIISNQV